MMLELGLTSVKYVLIKKRMMYLYHILVSSDTSLISQIFHEQQKSPLRYDWATMIKSDMKQIKLNLSNEELKMMTKLNFKKKIKDLCEKACFSDFMKQKSNLSKGKLLNYDKLEMQSFFHSKHGLSADSMRKIYSLRTRSLPLKCNAPSQYTDRLCLAPDCLEEDQEEHLYRCKFLSEGEHLVQSNIKYEDIFSCDVNKQDIVKNMFFVKYLKRAQYLPSHQHGGPEAPQGKQPSGSRETRRKRNKTQTKQAKP